MQQKAETWIILFKTACLWVYLGQGHRACGLTRLFEWEVSELCNQAMTQRTVNYLKPLELETNHQEIGRRLQESGLAIQTTQNHSSHYHCGTFHLIQGCHYRWNGPCVLSWGLHNSNFRGGRTLFCIILLFKLRPFSWMCEGTPRQHQR